MDQIGDRRQPFLGQWILVSGHIFQLRNIGDGLPPDGVSGGADKTTNVAADTERVPTCHAAKTVNLQ
jgi:hypothetical protein